MRRSCCTKGSACRATGNAWLLLGLQPLDLLLRVNHLGVLSSKAADVAAFCELHVIHSASQVAHIFKGEADIVVRVALPMNVTCKHGKSNQ